MSDKIATNKNEPGFYQQRAARRLEQLAERDPDKFQQELNELVLNHRKKDGCASAYVTEVLAIYDQRRARHSYLPAIDLVDNGKSLARHDEGIDTVHHRDPEQRQPDDASKPKYVSNGREADSPQEENGRDIDQPVGGDPKADLKVSAKQLNDQIGKIPNEQVSLEERATMQRWMDLILKRDYSDKDKLLMVNALNNLLDENPVGYKSGSPLTLADRQKLVRDLIFNVSTPNIDINQLGKTCSVAELETRAATLHPAQYVTAVAEVALTGEYVLKTGPNTGQVIHLSMIKDSMHGGEPDVNLGSRLFQVLLPNIAWQQPQKASLGYEYEVELKAGDVQYRLFAGRDREELVWRNGQPLTTPEGKPIDRPYLDHEKQLGIYEEITGASGELVFLEPKYGDLPPGRGAIPFDSEDTPANRKNFHQLLSRLATNPHTFPILLGVDASKPPFGDGRSTERKPHTIAIVGYDPKTKRVLVNNTNGLSSDYTTNGGIPTGILFNSISRA